MGTYSSPKVISLLQSKEVIYICIYICIYFIGEIIIGVQDVGSGWYLGQIDAKKGIFPLTHVWQLETKLLKVYYLLTF